MFKSMHPAVEAALIFSVLCLLMLAKPCEATPEIKYCKNFETGEVFVVEANMPCPYPTVEL
jgi:hypothetical protein